MQEAPAPGSMAQGTAESAPGSNPGGLRVLDCFTHTGSFGLNCAMAGAADVLSVDASELALQQAAEKVDENSLYTKATKHRKNAQSGTDQGPHLTTNRLSGRGSGLLLFGRSGFG
jgi:16S rRNA G966 N2-methylase RsmD